MGWWKEKYNGAQIEVGDEPMDRLAYAIKEYVTAYHEEIDRRPTSNEFLYALENILCAAGPDFFEDCGKKDIVGINTTTRQAPKTQKWRIGDYFAVPLAEARYSYGRIILESAGMEQCEFYTFESDVLLSLQQLLNQTPEVAFYKHTDGNEAFRRRRWKIIGYKPIPRGFEYPSFYLAEGQLIAKGKKDFPAQRRQTIRLEPMMYFPPEIIEERLRSCTFDHWPEIEEKKEENFPGYKAQKPQRAKKSSKKSAKSRPKKKQAKKSGSR